MEQRSNFLALCLLDALEDEDESVVENILLKYNVDPSYVQQERGIAPLHYSCGMSNHSLAVKITSRFLDCGADVNVRSVENMTPLHVAAMYGRLEIVKMLLERGALLDVYDDERKTPVLYAIEECHFEVVQLMRDHIFVEKFERKQREQVQVKAKVENSLTKELNMQQQSTPHRGTIGGSKNKNLLAVAEEDTSTKNILTPNCKHYNYDVTSPYYINITHRRHKPQPKFPVQGKPMEQHTNEMNAHSTLKEAIQSPEEEDKTMPINIFSLTKENLKELSKKTPPVDRSRLSLIQTWRDKVQRSRARASILKQYDDIDEMIDNVMKNDHLNFTNTLLRNSNPKLDSADVDSGACGSGSVASSCMDTNDYARLPQEASPQHTVGNLSLGNLIQKIARAQISSPVPDIEPEHEPETSFQTVPEMTPNMVQTKNLEVPDIDFTIRSPKSGEYFLQMTEAYVHTDDENGLVFYETKLLRNTESNKEVPKKRPAKPRIQDFDTTATSQSTNLTLPLDYETDALRAELTTFGDPPGPITKSTKRLYIKRLVKYKRKTVDMQDIQKKNASRETKFSVELYRTVRSTEYFEQISEYMKYEFLSMQFFANNQQKKQMREGHLKQSFIYMLIDPRISCNLPGESTFLDKFAVWKRFLESIFYVGKGKTSRPYSHLYDAMKTHSRLNNVQLNNERNANGKQISIKKQPLNVDLFKSPPKKSSDSKKLDRILDIWGHGNGVVCLHVFHNIVPTDAYTREAAIIDALSLQHLTNVKRGDYYGPAQTWTMKDKKYLGIALLYKAMQIYLAEGESQLSPSDLI